MRNAFELTIVIGNDAMQTPEQVAMALENVIRRLNDGDCEGSIRDENGNLVGHFSGDFEESEDSI